MSEFDSFECNVVDIDKSRFTLLFDNFFHQVSAQTTGTWKELRYTTVTSSGSTTFFGENTFSTTATLLSLQRLLSPTSFAFGGLLGWWVLNILQGHYGSHRHKSDRRELFQERQWLHLQINDTVKTPSTVVTVTVAAGYQRVCLLDQPTTTCHFSSRKFKEFV